jgi:hypothetical protein
MPAELASSMTPATDADRLLQAESLVRDHCGWHIAPVREDATYTTHDAQCGRIYLPTLRLVDVTEITLNGAALDVDLFVWDEAGWLEPKSGYWPHGPRGAALVVTFDHGFEDVPPSVERSVQAIAARGVSNQGGIKRQQVGPFFTDYGLLVDDSEKASLAPYVLTVV